MNELIYVTYMGLLLAFIVFMFYVMYLVKVYADSLKNSRKM